MLIRRLFFCVLITLILPVAAAWAQSSPAWMTLTWNGSPVDTLVQGDCYDFNAGPNAAGMTLDIIWSVNGGQAQYIGGWPSLDGNGQAANICTALATPAGQITFLLIRNTAGGPWVQTNYVLNMLPQATGAGFDDVQGYAGVDHYIFTVNNLQDRQVRVRFDHDGSQNNVSLVGVDGAGNYDSGTFDHYSYWGDYLITGVQDAAAQPENWTAVSAPYTILPPQPQSLTATPDTTVAGAGSPNGVYRLSAQNGGEMALSLRYGIWNLGQWTWDSESSWPWLYGTGANGWDGVSDWISAARCTKPGIYNFYQVKNSLHGEEGWKDIDSWLTVTGSGQPDVTSFTPASANAGQSMSVTIHGQDLCGVTQLQTSYPGLSFSNISNPDWSDGTSFTATFTISANAAPGNALVTISARGGTRSFYFGITQTGALPTISGVTPSIAPPGSIVSVTLAGTNLVNPALSTTWTGLSFSNVVPSANGKSLTVTFTISSAAPTGNPAVKVTSATGSASTSLFFIGSSSMSLNREYIYLGDRVIAADSP